jgi:hypothetical protein
MKQLYYKDGIIFHKRNNTVIEYDFIQFCMNQKLPLTLSKKEYLLKYYESRGFIY